MLARLGLIRLNKPILSPSNLQLDFGFRFFVGLNLDSGWLQCLSSGATNTALPVVLGGIHLDGCVLYVPLDGFGLCPVGEPVAFGSLGS
jgi:hypothetical protein